MISVISVVGQTQDSALGALGLNVQSFLFQLITFLLLLLILRRYAYPPIVKTLEERRKAVEQSIDQAKEAAERLEKAEEQIEKMLVEARGEAEELVAAGHREAAKMVEEAETKAAVRAEHIVKEAHAQMEHEFNQARDALRHETAKLVAEATGFIVKEKVDARKNADLIHTALQSAGKGGK